MTHTHSGARTHGPGRRTCTFSRIFEHRMRMKTVKRREKRLKLYTQMTRYYFPRVSCICIQFGCCSRLRICCCCCCGCRLLLIVAIYYVEIYTKYHNFFCTFCFSWLLARHTAQTHTDRRFFELHCKCVGMCRWLVQYMDSVQMSLVWFYRFDELPRISNSSQSF